MFMWMYKQIPVIFSDYRFGFLASPVYLEKPMGVKLWLSSSVVTFMGPICTLVSQNLLNCHQIYMIAYAYHLQWVHLPEIRNFYDTPW